LECLEERVVPTIIYKPVFGLETQSQDDSEHGVHCQVYLIFWGVYWTNGIGATQVPLVQAAAAKVVTSKFPTIVDQYGGDGSNMTIAGTAFYNHNYSDPPSGGFDPEDDVDDVVQTVIDNGTFPESDAGATGDDNGAGDDHTRIYVVVTPPNINSNVANAAGNNTVEADTDVGFLSIDSDDIGEAWVSAGNNGGPAGTGPVQIDQFSLYFSHEVGELMSDWDGEGYEVNYPAGAPNNPNGSTTGQIGDYEGNSYAFRLSNGVDVQPLWSRADFYPGVDAPGQGAWAVYDGTNQKFFLDSTGNWPGGRFNKTYALTIQGGQNGNLPDNITVGTVASGPQMGGVQVTENGETVTFDNGQITSIQVNANGMINIAGAPVPVNVLNSSAAALIRLGNSTNGVQDIHGPVNIQNSGGYSAVTVDDSADPSARTVILYNNGPANGSYTVISGLTPGGDIVLRGSQLSSLALRTGNGSNAFRIHDTPFSNAPGGLRTTVSTGGGNDLVTVDGTTGPLTLDAAGGSDTVNIGTGSLQTIRSSVTLTSSGGYSAVTVDDSADQSARTVLIYNNGPANGSYTVIDGLPSGGDIVLRGSQLSSLAVRAGSGGNTFRIHDTPLSNTPGGLTTSVSTGGGNDLVTVDGTTGPLTLDGVGGSDTVNLGTGSLQNIRSTVTMANSGGYSAVNVDDSADQSARTVIIYNNGPANGSYTVIDGLPSGGDIVLRGSQLSSLAVRAGSGGNTFRIHDTPFSNTPGGSTTTVTTGARGDKVTIDGTTGPLNVVGGGPNTTINLGNPDNDGVQHIHGAVNVQIFAGGVRTALNVNDSGDTMSRTALQTLPGMGFDIIRGLAPADVLYRGVQTGAVSITLGEGDNNTFTIENTNTAADSNPTTLTTGRGVNNTVNVLGITGPLNVVGGGPNTTVNLGNAVNRLDDIHGPLTITGATTLSVNDQGSTTPGMGYLVTDTFVDRGGPGGVIINYSNITSLVLNAGNGNNDDIAISRTPPAMAVTINAGTGNDLVHTVPLSVIGGPLTVNGQGSTTSLTLFDQNITTPQTYTVTSTNVTRTGGLAVTYANIQTLTINGGRGGNIFSVQSSAAGTSTTLNGGDGTNTLVGPNASTGFNITGNNAGNLSGGVSASFSNFQNLTGGSGNDAFLFANGARIGGNISDVGGAANSLDYSAYTTPVTVNLAGLTATGVSGSVVNILLIRGGAGNDSLTGNAASRTIFTASPGNDTVSGLGTDNFLYNADANGTTDRTWSVTAQNSGTLSFGASTTTFSGVQNLNGAGMGADAFVFADGAGVDGNIAGSGGGGINTLDYRAYSTSVIVDLQTGFATGVGGSVSFITVVFGGSGNGAPGAYNLLIGGPAGGDTLNGGLGRRNILAAGGGTSTLNGGNSDDLFIGGTTRYDTEAGLASWLQIANEWAGIDDYATRLALLSTPGSGVPLLDATTVTGNGGNNLISGSGELAWIFTDGVDAINGFDPASQQVLIAP
jgi:hypothetical protein